MLSSAQLIRMAALAALTFSLGCPSSNDEDPRPDAGDVDAAAADARTADGGTEVAPPRSTHQGIISIQDRTILGLPQAGHGMTMVVDLATTGRAPDRDEAPGTPTGCKVWQYDMASDPPPAPAGDIGLLTVTGTSSPFPQGCSFVPIAGYICPTASGEGAIAVRHSGSDVPAGLARVEVQGAAFTADDRGRYLSIAGDLANRSSNGSFAIVNVLSPTVVLALKAAGTDSSGFPGSYRVLAGAGTTPGLPEESPGDPVRNMDRVVVGIKAGGARPFQFLDSPGIDVGDAFTLDSASQKQLAAIPVDGKAFAIGCGGAGGSCGAAEGSVLQILATDGDVQGLSPFAMPPSKKKQVVITCVEIGGDGVVEVSAEISRLLAAAHTASPITRIRAAFMRVGIHVATNPAPLAPNPVRIVAGHQVLSFVTY